MATTSPRALRVGVLLDGHLVEERLFVAAEPITVGWSLRCRLSLPVDGVPHEHVLFAPDRGRWLLRVTAAIDGRIARGDAVIDELRRGAGERGVWTIALEPGARGKLRIGGATLLFQELAAPPAAPRVRLPPALRGTLADRVDPRLAVIVGASLLVHIGLATWASLTDREAGGRFEQRLARHVPPSYMISELTLPDEPALDAPGVAAEVAPARPPARALPRPDRAAGADDGARFATALTGNDERAGGPGELSAHQPGADLDDQIDDIRDGDRTVRVGDDDRVARDQPARLGTDRGPGIGDPDHVARLDKRERDREPRIRPIPLPQPPQPPNRLTIDVVIAKIQGAYMSGLQRCYRKALAGDAGLSGRVELAFTVDERGRLTDPSAIGLTPEVDACIAGQMTGWMFPAPKDRAGEPAEVSFQLVLALQLSD